MSDSSGRSRSRARRAAVQGLYQWQMTGQPAEEIIAQFRSEKALKHADEDYFAVLMNGVTTAVEDLDEHLRPILDRPVTQLDRVECAILRMGAYELEQRPDVPWRVIIDEAVELARVFGAEQSHKYVNGILDALARRVREDAARASEPPRRAGRS